MVFGNKNGTNRQDELAQRATDFIVDTIDKARSRAVDPIIFIARCLVYGLLSAIIGIAATVVFFILLIRFTHIYLGNIAFLPDGIWFTYFVIGLIFTIVGFVIWSLRHASSANSPHAS